MRKCLDEGARGGERHKGIKKKKPDMKEAREFVEKALHNFSAMTDFHKQGYSDWSASAGFYALYHGLLAILAKKGFESRNQSCTFALVEEMIQKGEVDITEEELMDIYSKDVTTDIEHSKKLFDIREKMQYSARTELSEQEFDELKKRVKALLDKLRLEVERGVE